MKCPYCDSTNSEVLESRIVENGNAVRRRRKCLKCGKRFTTHERIVKTTIWVIKKDGRREYFDKEKIKNGILTATGKRSISLELIDDITNQVEREFLKKAKQEVSSQSIGKSILRRLKKIDKVAWLRFASVYLEFEDLEDFATAMEKQER
jgi:transcriptional repressor NrdR